MAFYLLASILVSLLAGSSAPTPLYPLYQSVWGFSPIATTVVFGSYALAVLGSLLVLGRISDHVGRRAVLLVALAIQVVTMVVFATADGLGMLLIARVLQGLSTGAAIGAVGAGLLDIDRARGTTANAVAPLTGTALGAIGSGLLVQFLPIPTHLVYLVLIAVFAAQWIGVLLMPETSRPIPGAARSLRPVFALPGAVRRPMLAAIPALVALWSLAGFYASLGPALVRRVVGSTSLLLGGLALFLLAASAGIAVLILNASSARRMTVLGVAGLLAGSVVTFAGLTSLSPAVLTVGMLVSGAGFGAAFQGAVRSVVARAPEHQRAGVLSLVYVVSYLAFGLPAVIAGYLVVDAGGVLSTAKEYAVAVVLLAALAGAGVLREVRRARIAPVDPREVAWAGERAAVAARQPAGCP
jgi:MFS family permease